VGGSKDRYLRDPHLTTTSHIRDLVMTHRTLGRGWLTDVCGQEHFEEGRGEVIDALHIAASRMPYRPDIQYAF